MLKREQAALGLFPEEQEIRSNRGNGSCRNGAARQAIALFAGRFAVLWLLPG
jgi:hypothetical protein